MDFDELFRIIAYGDDQTKKETKKETKKYQPENGKKDLKDAANMMKSLYDNLVDAGFSEDQAFTIMMTMLTECMRSVFEQK